MGTDNLFRKRKAKDANSLKRRPPVRSSYERVLIVCEGEKTEPFYFSGLIDFYKLNTANVEVDGECGSSPTSVVNHAIELYKEEHTKGNPYDRVYCVIDRDTHQCFSAALQRLSAQRPKGAFFAVVSIPCFEYWFLCHFIYTRAAFLPTGRKSPGDLAFDALKQYWPDYRKGIQGAFPKLIDQLEFAKANARRGLADVLATGAYNPTTQVHELVEYLQNIKV